MNNSLSKSFDPSHEGVRSAADAAVDSVADTTEHESAAGHLHTTHGKGSGNGKARPKSGGKGRPKTPAVNGFYFPTLMSPGPTL